MARPVVRVLAMARSRLSRRVAFWIFLNFLVVEAVVLGQLLVDSVSKRDIPVVQASGLIFAGTYIMLNLAADVLSMLSNPKLRNPR